MPLFAAEYGLGVYRLMGRFPRQIVLYGGQAEVRMERERRAPACRAFCGAAAGRVPATIYRRPRPTRACHQILNAYASGVRATFPTISRSAA